ncbi:MAG: hypothetical protein AAF902_02400 [Chloroflexota bacterium]
MIRKVCQDEQCQETYYAERSTSKFCCDYHRTRQGKLDKKRAKTLNNLQTNFPDEAKRIDALDDYNLKNQLLDMAAIIKNKKAVPLILSMIWSMHESVTWQKQNKIDHLQATIDDLEGRIKSKDDQIESLVNNQKQAFTMIKSSLKENGVPLWQM